MRIPKLTRNQMHALDSASLRIKDSLMSIYYFYIKIKISRSLTTRNWFFVQVTTPDNFGQWLTADRAHYFLPILTLCPSSDRSGMVLLLSSRNSTYQIERPAMTSGHRLLLCYCTSAANRKQGSKMTDY